MKKNTTEQMESRFLLSLKIIGLILIIVTIAIVAFF